MTEQKIQAYVMGELPPEEAALVAEALAQDPALAALAREYEQIAEGLRQQRVAALQKDLLAYDKTLPAPPTSPAPAAAPKKPSEKTEKPHAPSRRKPWWPLLLAAVVVVGAFLFLMPQDDPAPARSLSEKYYVRPADPRTAGNQSQDSTYREAINLFFSEKDYAAAHQRFSILAAAGNYQATARFYLPHASFSLGQHDRADIEFEQALADANMSPVRITQLRWNAMINNLERGEDISEDLAQSWDSYFRAEALRKELAEQ